jgi:hypothetical protein
MCEVPPGSAATIFAAAAHAVVFSCRLLVGWICPATFAGGPKVVTHSVAETVHGGEAGAVGVVVAVVTAAVTVVITTVVVVVGAAAVAVAVGGLPPWLRVGSLFPTMFGWPCW